MVNRQKGWADPGTGGVHDLSDQGRETLWPRCVGSVHSAVARKAWRGVQSGETQGLAWARAVGGAESSCPLCSASGAAVRVKVACG